MEKADILRAAQQLKTVADLAELLNAIKREEFRIEKHPITEKQLRYFACSNSTPKRYKTFHIRKKSGGLREISAPCYEMRLLLRLINLVLKAIYTPGESAMGFAEGRSVVENAARHTGHFYVFNVDLENFFPSIPQARVWKRLQLPPFNFPLEVANAVAGLCCTPLADGSGNALPQGAPTSPLLTNAVCDKLDRRMRGAAKRFGLHYSRYADDMTFSSMHNVFQEDSPFRREMLRIISEEGFKLNEKKTRLQREGQRQEVTGLTVNQKVNVARKYVRDLRVLLHVWETQGYKHAYSRFYRWYKREKGYIKKGEPIMENVVGGKLNYLRMVRGQRDEACQKLQQRFERLRPVLFADTETEQGRKFLYVQPYTVAEFEQLFATELSLEVSARGKLVAKCVIEGKEKFLSVSRSTQCKLCPELPQLKPGDQVSRVPAEDAPAGFLAPKRLILDRCCVTLCQAKGKNFWLVTHSHPHRSACLGVQHAAVDADDLLNAWEEQGIAYAALKLQEALLKGQLEQEEGDAPAPKKEVPASGKNPKPREASRMKFNPGGAPSLPPHAAKLFDSLDAAEALPGKANPKGGSQPQAAPVASELAATDEELREFAEELRDFAKWKEEHEASGGPKAGGILVYSLDQTDPEKGSPASGKSPKPREASRVKFNPGGAPSLPPHAAKLFDSLDAAETLPDEANPKGESQPQAAPVASELAATDEELREFAEELRDFAKWKEEHEASGGTKARRVLVYSLDQTDPEKGSPASGKSPKPREASRVKFNPGGAPPLPPHAAKLFDSLDAAGTIPNEANPKGGSQPQAAPAAGGQAATDEELREFAKWKKEQEASGGMEAGDAPSIFTFRL